MTYFCYHEICSNFVMTFSQIVFNCFCVKPSSQKKITWISKMQFLLPNSFSYGLKDLHSFTFSGQVVYSDQSGSYLSFESLQSLDKIQAQFQFRQQQEFPYSKVSLILASNGSFKVQTQTSFQKLTGSDRGQGRH